MASGYLWHGGKTLSVVAYVYMLEKSLPIQRRFQSENPTFLGRCVLKGLAITTVVGPFVVLELCAKGIELGYRQQNGSQYRGNMWKTRAAVALGIPITILGGGMSLISVGMMPGADPSLEVLNYFKRMPVNTISLLGSSFFFRR